MSDEELMDKIKNIQGLLWRPFIDELLIRSKKWFKDREEAADRIEQLERERDGIRKAAWTEALDAAHQYTLMQYGLAFLKDPVDRARIIDMIGQRE